MVQRTITNGRVRILGVDYAPDIPLLPEHEGLRPFFGLYWLGDNRQEEFVSLWGERDHCDEENWPGVFCHENVFKWTWWHRMEN